MTAGAWWDEPTAGVRWFVQLGTGAEQDAVADEKLAQEVRGLPSGYRQALGAISARLALDPLTERPAEAHDPERVRITRLSADERGGLIIATGATMSVIARVYKPAGETGVVRVIRVIPFRVQSGRVASGCLLRPGTSGRNPPLAPSW